MHMKMMMDRQNKVNYKNDDILVEIKSLINEKSVSGTII